MPTKKTPARHSHPSPNPLITVTDLLDGDREDVETAAKNYHKLEVIDRSLVRAIIGAGPLNDDNDLPDAIGQVLAERMYDMAAIGNAIRDVATRCEQAGLETHAKDAHGHACPLEDLAFAYASAYARAAYLVGVAVGREMAGGR